MGCATVIQRGRVRSNGTHHACSQLRSFDPDFYPPALMGGIPPYAVVQRELPELVDMCGRRVLLYCAQNVLVSIEGRRRDERLDF